MREGERERGKDERDGPCIKMKRKIGTAILEKLHLKKKQPTTLGGGVSLLSVNFKSAVKAGRIYPNITFDLSF